MGLSQSYMFRGFTHVDSGQVRFLWFFCYYLKASLFYLRWILKLIFFYLILFQLFSNKIWFLFFYYGKFFNSHTHTHNIYIKILSLNIKLVWNWASSLNLYLGFHELQFDPQVFSYYQIWSLFFLFEKIS